MQPRCIMQIAALVVTVNISFSQGIAGEAKIKEHIEYITKATHKYQINVGGTLDEFNTAEYLETYNNNMRLESRFQPNKFLIIENVGDTDVVNPRIVINGRRSWFSAGDIIAGVVKPGFSDAEKVMALHSLLASHWVQAHENDRRPGPEIPGDESHPSRSTFKERANPVKALNCYYCGGCQFEAANLVILARAAGLVARPVWLNKLDRYGAHCVAEVFYDGCWHLFDPDQRSFYLDSDNTTIASFETLHKNPSLVERTVDGGFASAGLKDRSHQYADIWPPHVMAVENWTSTMDMTLRPGEKFIYRWDHIGKYRCGSNRRNIKPERPEGLVPYRLANGKIIFRPRLDNTELFQRAILSELNTRLTKGDLQTPRLQQEITGWPGFCIFKISSPYPIVGATARAKFYKKTEEDSCKVYLSVHDSNWTEVFSTKRPGQFDRSIKLDDFLNPLPSPAIYDYYLKFEIDGKNAPGNAWVGQIEIETDVQMAATSLPALSVGANKVFYCDQSEKSRKVRIAHGWIESSQTNPPSAPDKPISPAGGARVDMDSLKELLWTDAKDTDGSITDYHIQLSPRKDFLYPVSPNFDRIIGSAEPQWPLPAGWLVKGRTYYWRVRAKDDWGAWSRWSRPWKFKIKE